MDNEALNTKLYEKLFAEQEKFKGWLLTQPPEEILNHAYEYTIREDIVLAMEYHDVSDEQAKALLSSPAPLSEIFHAFEKIEGDHMDTIRGCIESRADDIIQKQAEALRALPVYSETAAYAREHGEREQYNASMQANIMCRTAIEDAIHDHYHDNRLDPAGAPDVLKRFGVERTCYVLAATVQDKDWDGRISSSNKQWAKEFEIPQDKTAWNSATYRRFVVGNAHPGLIDLFINQVRREVELMKARKPSVLKKLKEAQAAETPKTTPKQKEAER